MNTEKSTVSPMRILLRVAEAAEMLGLSRAKMYELLAANNEIPVVRVGRAVRVPRAALQAWVDQRTVAWQEMQSTNKHP
jgi:excisionase family DNA binding protein